MIQAAPRPNVRKYSNPNPLHQWLLRRFLGKVSDEVLQTLGTLEKPILLDVGCGEGYVLGHLRKAWPGLAVQGVDGDREALNLARASIPDIAFWQSDANHLPFRDHSFDMVICLEVLEHLREPRQTLEELARVSRRYVLVSVPHQPYFALANFLRGQNLSRLGEDPDHLHHWTASQFLTLVRGRLKTTRLCHPFPWVLVLAET
ncbi:MAG: class I SAM-dependent methyltransferase [Dehalococcoidia bacterium]|nr:class I SAM-dependent methyltransferase [Dehalococcoidia bacterium]